MSIVPPWDRPSTRDLGAERLGPYVLIDDVAASELNTIHLARPHDAPAHAEPLIIKRLRREFVGDPERRSALEREASVLGQLRSPYVVHAHLADGITEPCVVMERVEGATLANLLACSDAASVETTRMVLPLIADALWGLDDLHRAQPLNGNTFLVHQAPCARHVMVSLGGRARLIDLTLAMGPEQPRSPLADRRLRPEEMAPEQALAPAQVDPRCDIFIAGVMLWEALTGRRLFADVSPEASLQKMLRSTLVSPGEVGAAARRVLDPVCMRALSRARGQRYPSAAEMASDLCARASKAGLLAEHDEIAGWVARLLARPSHAVVRNAKLHGTMQGLGGIDALFDESTPSPRKRLRREASRTLAGISALPSLPAPSVPAPHEDDRREEVSTVGALDLRRVTLDAPPLSRRSRARSAQRKLNLTLVCLAAFSVGGVALFASRTPSARSAVAASIPAPLRDVLPEAVLGTSAAAAPPPARREGALPTVSATRPAEPPRQADALRAESRDPAPALSARPTHSSAERADHDPPTERAEMRDVAPVDVAPVDAAPEDVAPVHAPPTRSRPAPRASSRGRAKPQRAAPKPTKSAPPPAKTSEWSPGPPIGGGTSLFGAGGLREVTAPASAPLPSSASPTSAPTPAPASPPEDLPINPY